MSASVVNKSSEAIKRKRDEECNNENLVHPNKIYKINDTAPSSDFFKIHPVTKHETMAQNFVWLNPSEFNRLFAGDAPPYLRIANRVYHVATSANIQPSWIGMDSIQILDTHAAVLNLDNNRHVIGSLFTPSEQNVGQVRQMKFEVDLYQDSRSDKSQFVVALHDLRTKIQEVLKDQYFSTNQSYFLHFPWGSIEARIDQMGTVFQPHMAPSLFGKLMDSAQLDFVTKRGSRLTLVDRVFASEVKQFFFSVDVTKRNPDAKEVWPIVVDVDEIADTIRTSMGGKLCFEGQKQIVNHPSGWDIELTFRKAIVDPFILREQMSQVDLRFDYITGYMILRNSRVDFEVPRSRISLIKGEPLLIREAEFTVLSISNDQLGKKLEHHKVRYVDLEEIRRRLRERVKPLVKEEIFELDLSSGRFVVMLHRFKADSPWDATANEPYLSRWYLDERSSIKITTDTDLGIKLVGEPFPYPAARIVVSVRPSRVLDEDLHVHKDEIAEAFEDAVSDYLLKGDVIKAEADNGEPLDFEIEDVEFSDWPNEGGKITYFAEINDETEIDFVAKTGKKIVVIDEVYRDEVNRISFGLSASKREDAGNWERLPLVVDKDEIMRKIKEKFNDFEYNFKGRVFTVRHSSGYDIRVSFKNAFLKKGVLTDEEKNRQSHNQHKLGYMIGESTKLEMQPLAAEIVLTEGRPLVADTLNFKLLEVVDPKNRLSNPHVTGSWIDLQELQEALIDLKQDFATGQNVVVDLSSGRFKLEVRKGVGGDPRIAILKKKSNCSTRWLMKNGTEVNLGVEKSQNITVVKDSKEHELKKIKIKVQPEKRSREHVSLKEEELLNVFKERLPKRLVKGISINGETDSNHSVTMTVFEFTFKDENLRSSARVGVFGKITDDTVIEFVGKEESNLAVQTAPKILDIKDPIKYLEELGIGGIDDQFRIIHRIFYSRSVKLRDEAQKRGTKPIRGIMLFGPPGTGKTTLARHLGDMLGCSGDRLKMITATEIFNMFVGQSEANIRELFAPARESAELYKDESPLYMVVVDEIDAILPQRGGSVNKWRDSVVNQFLGEMDGLNQLNNILVVGITNRKDQIDPAALRHGRFGVHVEIGVPDSKGRKKIFEIHTKKLKDHNILDDSVDIQALADRTDKFTGADIEGLVDKAALFSLERISKLDENEVDLATSTEGKVTMQDFEKALNELDKKEEMSDSVRMMYT